MRRPGVRAPSAPPKNLKLSRLLRLGGQPHGLPAFVFDAGLPVRARLCEFFDRLTLRLVHRVGVPLGRPDVAVPEYLRDDDDVDPRVGHPRGCRVPEVVKPEVFDLGRVAREAEGALDVYQLPAGLRAREDVAVSGVGRCKTNRDLLPAHRMREGQLSCSPLFLSLGFLQTP